MCLPVYLNRFFDEAQMDSASFFARWKNLSGAGQEQQKIFKALHSMDYEETKTTVIFDGFFYRLGFIFDVFVAGEFRLECVEWHRPESG